MKLIYIGIIVLFSACTMNKLFLSPTKLDRNATVAHIYDYDNDRPLELCLGAHFQPTIYDSLNNLVDPDFNIESVEFVNQKGDSLNGWFMSPKENGNGVTLFYLHGNAGSIYYQFGLMVPFVKQGYTVFMFDYSGFGYSQGKAKIKRVYTDAQDAFAYLKTRKEYLNDKLIVYGQSLGAHLTAAISHSIEKDVDAFVMEGGFANHDEVAAQTSGLGWFAKMMVRERYSGLDTIPLVSKPKLFIHSTEDTRVNYINSEMLFEAAKEPKSFYSIDGRHIFGPLLYGDSIDQRMLNMLK